MALLPAENLLDGTKTPATTTAEMRGAFGTLRRYLAELLGTDSTDKAAARSALGAAPVVSAVLSKNVAGNSDIILLPIEALNDMLIFTGALTANISVIVPDTAKAWNVWNKTTGAFALTLKTAAGAGVPIAQGKRRDLWCDGSDVLAGLTDFSDNPIPVAPPQITVRQCVTSGPTDANGQAAFGGVTGSTSVTTTAISAAAALVVNAAAGISAAGALNDRIGFSAANLTWNGLNTNGTMFLYVDVAANGALTPGSTILAPTYQQGGANSIVSGQFTFNIALMNQTVGNAVSAAQSYRVFLGEVQVVGGVVSSITWYGLNGRFAGVTTNTLPASAVTVSANHNLGIPPKIKRWVVTRISALDGYAAGQEVQGVLMRDGSSITGPATPTATRNAISVTAGNSSIGLMYMSMISGTYQDATGSVGCAYRFEAERGW